MAFVEVAPLYGLAPMGSTARLEGPAPARNRDRPTSLSGNCLRAKHLKNDANGWVIRFTRSAKFRACPTLPVSFFLILAWPSTTVLRRWFH